MRTLFADTSYWIALANPRDQSHALAVTTAGKVGPFVTVTSDEVLTEFLNYFAERGEVFRKTSVQMVQGIQADPNTRVLPQSRASFLAGLSLYSERTDKGYSLTDCISMEHMRRERLTEALTTDQHFAQEGFVALLRDGDS